MIISPTAVVPRPLACAAVLCGLLLTPIAPLTAVGEVALPLPASRFDYQSLDPTSGLLYVSHMGAGRLVVFDTRHSRVAANIPGFPVCTGVLAVPQLHRVYVSATGAHEVVVLSSRTRRIVARIPGPRFPDGMAYDPGAGRLFVSDEFGRADWVIDAKTNRVVKRIALGGEAGNTQYDAAGRRILVTVQTRNEIASIDPVAARITARYPLPGSDHPHGLYIDDADGLAFAACEADDRLLTVDLRSMKVLASSPVGGDPDVLAFDPGLHRLYVASESGVVWAFRLLGKELTALGAYDAPHAHSVAVDPQTHQVYLPLQAVGGRPVMRILAPAG